MAAQREPDGRIAVGSYTMALSSGFLSFSNPFICTQRAFSLYLHLRGFHSAFLSQAKLSVCPVQGLRYTTTQAGNYPEFKCMMKLRNSLTQHVSSRDLMLLSRETGDGVSANVGRVSG